MYNYIYIYPTISHDIPFPVAPTADRELCNDRASHKLGEFHHEKMEDFYQVIWGRSAHSTVQNMWFSQSKMDLGFVQPKDTGTLE